MAMLKTQIVAGCQWFTPVILATQEAEIRRITVRSQPGQIVRETLSQKKKNHKKGLVQNVGPEFKPQYHKKKTKTSNCGSMRTNFVRYMYMENVG
jgi:hypothetical protein